MKNLSEMTSQLSTMRCLLFALFTQTLRHFAASSESVNSQILACSNGSNDSRYSKVTSALLDLINDAQTDTSVIYRTLILIGELAHSSQNRARLLSDSKILTTVYTLSERKGVGDASSSLQSLNVSGGGVNIAGEEKCPKLRREGNVGVFSGLGKGFVHGEPREKDVADAARCVWRMFVVCPFVGVEI